MGVHHRLMSCIEEDNVKKIFLEWITVLYIIDTRGGLLKKREPKTVFSVTNSNSPLDESPKSQVVLQIHLQTTPQQSELEQ